MLFGPGAPVPHPEIAREVRIAAAIDRFLHHWRKRCAAGDDGDARHPVARRMCVDALDFESVTQTVYEHVEWRLVDDADNARVPAVVAGAHAIGTHPRRPRKRA